MLKSRQPELLARHCAEAGLVDKAAALWGNAGQRSLARSALEEGTIQLNRALAQIAALPSTAVVRREQIKFQVALANALMHIKGYAAAETKASLDQARLYIERAEALGEPPEDSLLLSVLYGFWVANYVAFNGDATRALAVQFLALAEKQRRKVPLMSGHGIMGASLLLTGDIAGGQAHCDQAIALYNRAEHRPLATRFGQDVGVATLSYRSFALWLLGFPEAARTDIEHALKKAREIGQAATLMHTLAHAPWTHFWIGTYNVADTLIEEVIALASEKGALMWKACGMMHRGTLLALTGKAANAIPMITSAMKAMRSTGSTLWIPSFLSYLARAYAELGRLNDAWRCISEAMTAVETSKERWCEAEVNRIAAEIALKSPEPETAQAEAYLEQALAIARKQQAKSWELRAAMSMARLWRDQGKPDEARDLLAPVYGWFTEGFDTRDLKEAKTLLDDWRREAVRRQTDHCSPPDQRFARGHRWRASSPLRSSTIAKPALPSASCGPLRSVTAPPQTLAVSGVSRLAQQVRQLRDVGGDAARLIAGEALVGRGVASGGSASAFYAETGTGLIQINIKVFRHGEIGCPSMGGDNDDTFTHGSAAARVRIGNACSSTAKQSVSISKTTADTRYTQEHMIDVGDVPGHQVRIYEINVTYKKGELAFDGVEVKEGWGRSMSDYTNGSGPAMTYATYVLEDGNKVFSKSTVAAQTTANPDGTKTVKFIAVENFVGGTGRFAGIRGQILSSGSRVPGEKALTLQGTGEYWIEK